MTAMCLKHMAVFRLKTVVPNDDHSCLVRRFCRIKVLAFFSEIFYGSGEADNLDCRLRMFEIGEKAK